MSITLEQVKQSEEITSYIRKADESLSALGLRSTALPTWALSRRRRAPF